MSNATKIWLIAAASLVVFGIVILVLSAASVNWNLTKFSTEQYETNTYKMNKDFSSISIKADTADVVFAPSEDGTCKVTCYEQQKEKHSAEVQNGTLVIQAVSERKWYDHIGIHFGTPKITVHLPKTQYDSLVIEGDTGSVEIPEDFKFGSIDICVSTGLVKCSSSAQAIRIATNTGGIYMEDISAGSIDLSVSTGKVTASDIVCDGDITVRVTTGKIDLTNATCKNVISSGSTGDISLNNVIATERFSIERSTGDVELDGCDAAEIFIETDTGDVTGTLLSEKVFIAKTDTGRIRVPSSASGGRCEISTDTGDIRIKIS